MTDEIFLIIMVLVISIETLVIAYLKFLNSRRFSDSKGKEKVSVSSKSSWPGREERRARVRSAGSFSRRPDGNFVFR